MDPDAFVLAANANRRHLSTEQKGDLIRRVLAVRPTLSNRQLARLVGVNGPSVATIRAEQCSTAEPPQFNTQGASGKLSARHLASTAKRRSGLA